MFFRPKKPKKNNRSSQTMTPNEPTIEASQDVGLTTGVAEKQLNRQKTQGSSDCTEYPVDTDQCLQYVPESILDELTIRPIPDQHLSRARNRQSLFLQKRRQSKNRKIVAKRTNFFFKLFTAIIMLAGLWLFLSAKFWVLMPDQIQIQHSGNGYAFIQDQDIVHAIQPSLKFPLYMLAPQKLATILEKRFPQIATVSVRRRIFPLRLDVMITEKPIWGALFYLSPTASYKVGDIEASIQKTFDGLPETAAYKNVGILHMSEAPAYVSTVKLSPSQQAVLHHIPIIIMQKQRLTTKQLGYLQQTLALIQAGQSRLNGYNTQLLWVDARNVEDSYLYFSTFKVHAGPIDQLLKERISRLFEVLPLIEEQKTNLDYVDLAWRNQMTFKMKGQLANTESLQ